MIKKICLIFILISFSFQGKAQSFITNYKEKTFNWGGKIGLNASIPIVKSITIKGIEMENINQQYTVSNPIYNSYSLNEQSQVGNKLSLVSK